jgi:hypothetical protein
VESQIREEFQLDLEGEEQKLSANEVMKNSN